MSWFGDLQCGSNDKNVLGNGVNNGFWKQVRGKHVEKCMKKCSFHFMARNKWIYDSETFFLETTKLLSNFCLYGLEFMFGILRGALLVCSGTWAMV